MVGKAVRGLGILGVVAASATATIAMFIENSTGEFAQVLNLQQAGIQIFGLAFIPLALYLLYKSV